MTGGLDLDRSVVLRGAGHALCWIVPLGIANAVAGARDSGALVFLTFIGIVVGFAFGGYAVAREPIERPLQHATAAAVLAFVVVQAAGLAIAVGRGTSISIPGIIVTGLLAASMGVMGGLLAIKGAGPTGSRRAR